MRHYGKCRACETAINIVKHGHGARAALCLHVLFLGSGFTGAFLSFYGAVKGSQLQIRISRNHLIARFELLLCFCQC